MNKSIKNVENLIKKERKMPNLFSKAPSYYTDLMSERQRVGGDGIDFKRNNGRCGVWERIHVMSEAAAEKIGRPIGHYHTFNVQGLDMIDSYDAEDIAEEIASELWHLCEFNALVPKKLLVVGLGNEELTPDSLGPLAAKQIEATMHLRASMPDMFAALGCIEIASLRPGVVAQSGIESTEAVVAISERMKPDVIIAIDALCAESETRLGCTVQLSDTGIFPGSGVGNPRGKITKETVGCPVLSIGIPTVIDAGIISKRAFGERMLVTPRGINAIVKTGSAIVADSINRAFGVVR